MTTARRQLLFVARGTCNRPTFPVNHYNRKFIYLENMSSFDPPSEFIKAGIPYWLTEGDDPSVLKRQPLPSRDSKTNCFLFDDYPDFRPNLSPDQVLRAGSFGGTYFRSIHSKTANQTFDVGVHLEFPQGWFEGIDDVSKLVTSPIYSKEINKYGVKSGNDLNFWEQKGWMRKQDPYGWFQWYCRFYLGRRTVDDERQVSRWIKAIGPRGRWRTFLVGQCVKANKSFDDVSASPVTRQTLLHWGYEITSADFNALAPAIQNGKSVIYMGPVVDETKKGRTRIRQKLKPQPKSSEEDNAVDSSTNDNENDFGRRCKRRKRK